MAAGRARRARKAPAGPRGARWRGVVRDACTDAVWHPVHAAGEGHPLSLRSQGASVRGVGGASPPASNRRGDGFADKGPCVGGAGGHGGRVVVPSLVTIHLRRHGEVEVLFVPWSSSERDGPRFDGNAVIARSVFGDAVRGPTGGCGAVGTEYSVQREGALCWLNLRAWTRRQATSDVGVGDTLKPASAPTSVASLTKEVDSELSRSAVHVLDVDGRGPNKSSVLLLSREGSSLGLESGESSTCACASHAARRMAGSLFGGTERKHEAGDRADRQKGQPSKTWRCMYAADKGPMSVQSSPHSEIGP